MVHGEFHTVYRRACDRAHFGAVVVGMFNHPQREVGGEGRRLSGMRLVGGYDIDLSHLFDAVNKMVYAFGVDAVVVGYQYQRFHICN